jgi:hypothetical protein
MKKFNFVEPIKIKVEEYPNVNSVYKKDGDDDEGYKDFFSFENGVDVDDKQTQEWVNEHVQYLLDNPEEKFSYCQGGNTLVMCTRGEDEIRVWVSKSHMEAYIPLYEPTYFDSDEEAM